jgi:hypothetical protein
MYFKNFKNILYDFSIKTDKEKYYDVLADITTRVTTHISPEGLSALCDSYMINNGETPEMVALKMYKNPELHWTILYVNEISDTYSQWPLTEAQLSDYCTRSYGSTLHDTKWVIKIPENIVMDRSVIENLYGADYAVNVTNWEFEVQKNEQKRFIKIIKPQYIGEFVDRFLGSLVV